MNTLFPSTDILPRRDEIHLIVDCITRGSSVSFVGLPGVGKTDIVYWLFQGWKSGLLERRFGLANTTVLCNIPCVAWNGTPSHVWEMMASALNTQLPELQIALPSGEAEAFDTLCKLQQTVIEDTHHRITYVFDDFDSILVNGPVALLENLWRLQEGPGKHDVTYVLFTNMLPYVLAGIHGRSSRLRFLSVFRDHMFALAPYNDSDALLMLTTLNKASNNRLSERDLATIHSIAGGHAGLMMALFGVYQMKVPTVSRPDIKEPLVLLANEPDIRVEWERIFQHLHPDERKAVESLVNRDSSVEARMALHLQTRGLLTNTQPITWFSPLLPLCLKASIDSTDHSVIPSRTILPDNQEQLYGSIFFLKDLFTASRINERLNVHGEEMGFGLRKSPKDVPLYHSCFISCSSLDQAFVDRLYADLRAKGVRVWYDREDMKIGDDMRPAVEIAIHNHEKSLVVLSERSIGSTWVQYEVEAALEREKKEGARVLFPIRIDDSVICTNQAWAAKIRRERHIGDFRQWKDHDAYQAALERLLRDLKAEEG